MHRRIRAALVAATAALSCLAAAGVASAASPTPFSGTVANGGCDSGHAVTVSGPSRIEAQISSTSATGEVYAEIISPSGNVDSTGRYDTPGGGTYTIRVCSYYDAVNPPTLEWRGIYGTGPAGQSPLSSPAQPLSARQTASHDIHGKAAIRTRAGLAWFTVKLNPDGSATVKVFNPALRKSFRFTGATTFGATAVRIATHGMTMTVAHRTAQRIAFHSRHFKAKGMVVRGGYVIA